MPGFHATRHVGIVPFHVLELLARAEAQEAEGRGFIHTEADEPGFPTPEPIIAAAQVHIATGRLFYAENNFQPTLTDLEQNGNKHTVGALFVSPANPTGTLLDDVVLAAIAGYVRHKRELIVDEIYHGLTYEREASTALQFSDDIYVMPSISKYVNTKIAQWLAGCSGASCARY